MANTRYQVGDELIIADNYYYPERRGQRARVLSVYQHSHGTSYYVQLPDTTRSISAMYLRKTAEKQPSESAFLKLLG